MPNFHTLKRYSHRNAPRKLIPAIIACKCFSYLMFFGFLICLCALIPLFITNPIDEQFIDNNESINKTLTTNSIELNDTITTIIDKSKEYWIDRDNACYIFYTCIGIGSLLLITGVICLLIAYYYFQTYQEERIRHIQVTDLDAEQRQPVITDPIIDGVGYPISLIKGKSKQSEYLPISQTNNMVYKSTTEPIK